MSDQIAEVLYRRMKATQRELGLARFELGTLLEVFKNNDSLWRGRAESFHGFLEEERISADGARQFMRIAKKYVLELGLSDEMLAELACVNFRILDMAAKVITPENKEEVLALVIALGERDARVALAEFGDEATGNQHESGVPKEVQSLLRRFRALPDDFRATFLGQFRQQRSAGNAQQ
ncbi:MAG: hypothetical protein QMB52_11595 [Propionivibrio sp.]